MPYTWTVKYQDNVWFITFPARFDIKKSDSFSSQLIEQQLTYQRQFSLYSKGCYQVTEGKWNHWPMLAWAFYFTNIKVQNCLSANTDDFLNVGTCSFVQLRCWEAASQA